MKKVSGITKRWVLNTLCVIIAVMAVIATLSSAFIYSYYYDSVSRTLESHTNEVVSTFFNLYSGSSEELFETGAREFVENFDDKETIEVWVINKNGKVVASSSGFDITETNMPDYKEACSSNKGKAIWTGKMSSGEKVMAMSIALPPTADETSSNTAVRYIISLKDIDTQIYMIISVIIFVCLLSISLVALSGSFFIRSIVRPVNKLNEMAKQIAAGNFNTHIDRLTYNDEIGELCETINYMSQEISQTDKIKNDFISTVSHELRTPLTAINGWGETILQSGASDTEVLNKGVKIIVSESKRLTEMVEELLDFSRIQSGRMTLQIEKIDVLAELDETVFVFRERAQREGIEVVYNATDAIAPMNGDPNRIKQVFANVLDNAIKYNKQGGKIVIIAEVTTEQVRIIIGDSGCGISPEDLPKVKEKFYKANVSVRGSGIGLAVADEVVKLHGGELIIDSVLNVGTTITILLPIIPPEIPTMVLPDERSEENNEQ
ncbi:MAG: HAMP domain-containing histidine kinase [Clostridiales bacterium]|nr:HAMP domain-containing histidine kinase [Clostridiales bacterium]